MTDSSETVIILPGIFLPALWVGLLTRRLRMAGYRAVAMGYPSTSMDLEAIRDWLAPRIARAAQGGTTHLVGYSMGGLVVRMIAADAPPPGLDRVVQVGAPNEGSELVDLIRDWRLYRLLYGPAGQQLGARNAALGRLLGPVSYPLGSIAGDGIIDPVSGHLILPKPNDGKVTVRSALPDGAADAIVLPVSHLMMCHSRRVAREVGCFLENGRFSAKAPRVTPRHDTHD